MFLQLQSPAFNFHTYEALYLETFSKNLTTFSFSTHESLYSFFFHRVISQPLTSSFTIVEPISFSLRLGCTDSPTSSCPIRSFSAYLIFFIARSAFLNWFKYFLLWGSRHNGLFLASLAAFRSSRAGAMEAVVYID